MKNTIIYYSTNDEDFCYSELEDAVNSLDAPKVGDVVYRAKFKRLDAESVHITNDICDIIYGKMIDLCGETADDFEIENSKYVELDTFIKKWSEEIGINTYYTIVGDSQEYVITQQDLEK